MKLSPLFRFIRCTGRIHSAGNELFDVKYEELEHHLYITGRHDGGSRVHVESKTDFMKTGTHRGSYSALGTNWCGSKRYTPGYGY